MLQTAQAVKPQKDGVTPEASSEEVLSAEARRFLIDLVRAHRPALESLLRQRAERQRAFDNGQLPGFLPETAYIRAGDWKVAPLPGALKRRRVEITGPVSAKMIINALNSGADVFMADFEDASSPTWENMLEGQANLRKAARGTLSFDAPRSGKHYALNKKVAALMVRPRGLHLPEAHFLVDGAPAPASLFDAGLFLFHNAKALAARGAGPWLYLPKLESHHEARWWDEVFAWVETRLLLPLGTIKATVLIETLPAAFEMDEILYALRNHAAGLNCGRWDYIFSYIKTLRAHPAAVLPDRGQVGMGQPFMAAYSRLLIETCHKRGAMALGGMAAQIPIKGDDRANQAAMNAVKADKIREVANGHDGTWVAHPGLVPLAMEIFNEGMTGPNQLNRPLTGEVFTADDLLKPPKGTRTEAGLRLNIRVGIQYLAAWLGGSGCVPLYHLMEDAATAEISRTQLWAWRKNGAQLDDGRTVTDTLLCALIDDEVATLKRGKSAPSPHFQAAVDLFSELIFAGDLADFLTLAAYPHLDDPTRSTDR